MKKICFASLLLLLIYSGCGQNIRTDSGADVSIINAAELKRWIDYKIRLYIIDLRAAELYQKSHIPKAILLSEPELERLQGRLPGAAIIVVYSQQGDEQKIAVTRLHHLGFQNVIELSGGFNAWIYETEE